MKHLNLGAFTSHRGSNLQAIIDSCKESRLNASFNVVISNNSGSQALQRAKSEGIPAYHLSHRLYPLKADLDRVIIAVLHQHNVELIVLAGYMKELGKDLLEEYKGRIINIHPSLLPRHGGQGMYGIKVHEAVIQSGDQKTGATVHLVEGEFDSGRILSQREIAVEDTDTPETLAARVIKVEHQLYVDTLAQISRGEILL